MIALLCIFVVSYLFLQLPCDWLKEIFFIHGAACTDIKVTIGLVSFTSLCTLLIVGLYLVFEWAKEQLEL
jgi:hypothetical protein